MFSYFLFSAFCLYFLLVRRFVINENDKRTCDLFICILLVCFSGFRYKVGADYCSYEDWFYRILSTDEIEIEIIYHYLVKFCGLIGGTQQLVFFICSAITIAFAYLFIINFSENIEISLLLYIFICPYYISSFNGVRQHVAISIFAYSLKFVKENKFLKYFIFIMLASGFQRSVLLLVALYPILKLKINFIYVILLGFIYIILEKLGLIKNIAYLLGGQNYLNYYSRVVKLDISWYIYFLLNFGVCVFYQILPCDSEKGRLMLNLNYLSLITIIILFVNRTISQTVFVRYNMYFFSIQIVLVPYILNYFSKKYKSILEMLVIIFSLFYFFIVISTASHMRPYLVNFKLFY